MRAPRQFRRPRRFVRRRAVRGLPRRSQFRRRLTWRPSVQTCARSLASDLPRRAVAAAAGRSSLCGSGRAEFPLWQRQRHERAPERSAVERSGVGKAAASWSAVLRASEARIRAGARNLHARPSTTLVWQSGAGSRTTPRPLTAAQEHCGHGGLRRAECHGGLCRARRRAERRRAERRWEGGCVVERGALRVRGADSSRR